MNKKEVERLIGELFSAYLHLKVTAHIDGVSGDIIALDSKVQKDYVVFHATKRRGYKMVSKYTKSTGNN